MAAFVQIYCYVLLSALIRIKSMPELSGQPMSGWGHERPIYDVRAEFAYTASDGPGHELTSCQPPSAP